MNFLGIVNAMETIRGLAWLIVVFGTPTWIIMYMYDSQDSQADVVLWVTIIAGLFLLLTHRRKEPQE